MKIDILCNQEPNGSFIGVTSKTVWGDSQRIGVGGAELAIITMAEEWTKAGHDVVLYNSPWKKAQACLNSDQFHLSTQMKIEMC